MTLLVRQDSIGLDKRLNDNWEWQYGGTDGIFLYNDAVFMFFLSSPTTLSFRIVRA